MNSARNVTRRLLQLQLPGWILLGLSLFLLQDAIRTGALDPGLFFNADALYIPALYQDIFRTGYGIAGWKTPPAPCFFPDMPLMFFSMALGKTAYAAVRIYAVGMVLLFVAALRFLYDGILPPVESSLPSNEGQKAVPSGNDKGKDATPGKFLKGIPLYTGTLLTLSILAGSGPLHPSMPIRTFLIAGFHGGNAINTILSLALLIRLRRRETAANHILYFLMVLTGSISDRIYIPLFSIPVMLALLPWFKARPWTTLRIYGSTMLAAYLSHPLLLRVSKMAGFYLYDISPNPSSTISLLIHPDPATPFLLSWYPVTDSIAPLYFVFVAILLFLASYSFARSIKQNSSRKGATGPRPPDVLINLRTSTVYSYNKTISFLTLYILLYYPIAAISLAFILLQVYHVVFVPYHYSLIFMMPLIWLPPLLEFLSRNKGKSATILASILALFSVGPGLKENLTKISWSHPLTTCMDSLSTSYDLKNGISDYWNGKLVRVLSEKEIKVNQLYYNLNINYWISNINWYYGIEKKPEYTFIIPERLNEKAILKEFGIPARVLHCGSTRIFLYGRRDHPGDERLRTLFTRNQLQLWRKLTGQ